LRGHEEYKEMIAAHALSSLETAEARELEAHLATCAECRAESESWQDVAASLVYAAPLAEPSAELRSRILANVRAEESAMQNLNPATGDGKVEGRASLLSRTESNVVPFEKPARRTRSAVSKVWAIAASVAFVALALSLILLWTRYSSMQREMAQLTDQLGQAHQELSRERETLARERAAKELISAPEARITALAGTELATRARAKFVYDRKTGRAMLMADDLPPAPAGKAYQLWFIAEGKPPMPGHVFNTDAAGHAEMAEQLPEEARAATIFAVTLEPSGGVPAPTGAKYLLGTAS
jgi:anti-sigma-K factor RskA/cell division protein FtsL